MKLITILSILAMCSCGSSEKRELFVAVLQDCDEGKTASISYTAHVLGSSIGATCTWVVKEAIIIEPPKEL